MSAPTTGFMPSPFELLNWREQRRRGGEVAVWPSASRRWIPSFIGRHPSWRREMSASPRERTNWKALHLVRNGLIADSCSAEILVNYCVGNGEQPIGTPRPNNCAVLTTRW